MDKIRILLVEDEYIIAEDIKRTLMLLDYDIIGMASTGVKAIKLAEKYKPDIILMDIMLDGELSGLDVAKYINKEFNIPIVFLTAYANEEILQEATKSNPFGYLLKPFDDRELNATIKMAIYKSSMENRLLESERFLWNVIDMVPDYIFVKDNEHRYVLVNKALAKIFGTNPKNMIGKTDEVLMGEFLDNISTNKKVFETRDIISSSKTTFNAEQRLEFTNGSGKWVQTTKVPLVLSNDIPSMLGVAVDITNRKNIEMELKVSYEKMKRVFEQTIKGFVIAVEIRDPYTAGHQKKVAVLAEKIGEYLGLEKDRLDGLRIAAIIHDIGKIYVPAEILNRPGRISEVEFNLIKTHPLNGYNVLKDIEFPWPIAQIVYQHHERLDGTGYPRQLKSEEILLEAQILSVADIMEAMMSHRPYRPALGYDRAINEIKKYRGTGFSEEIVDICEKIFIEDGFEFEKNDGLFQ